MDVRAVFELPVHIWVMREALGRDLPDWLRPAPVRRRDADDGSPTAGPPAVEGIESRPELTGGTSCGPTSTAPSFPSRLCPRPPSFGSASPTSRDPPTTTRSWFTPEHQLAEYVTPWFDNVRTWVEVVTGQDLDPNHRVYDAEAVGAGLTFIEPPNDAALGLRSRRLASSRCAPGVGAHPGARP